MESFARIESVNLRPLALPAEHGGWGILLEPLALGLLVAPSRAGALIAAAAGFAFLARHPLKLAMQDLVRGHAFARTMWCWAFAAWYGAVAAVSLGLAVGQSSVQVIAPFVLAAPFAMVMIVHDARRKSRALWPEVAGALAMATTAASIAIAAGWSARAALILTALIALRSVPSIVYVRALLGRTSKSLAVALHVIAFGAGAYFGLAGAMTAYTALLGRAAWGLAHDAPPAKTIGWREIAWGVLTVGLLAITPPIWR